MYRCPERRATSLSRLSCLKEAGSSFLDLSYANLPFVIVINVLLLIVVVVLLYTFALRWSHVMSSTECCPILNHYRVHPHLVVLVVAGDVRQSRGNVLHNGDVGPLAKRIEPLPQEPPAGQLVTVIVQVDRLFAAHCTLECVRLRLRLMLVTSRPIQKGGMKAEARWKEQARRKEQRQNEKCRDIRSTRTDGWGERQRQIEARA